MKGRPLSRRTLLRGAGVALALPWLESLSPEARAQASAGPLRFVPIFLPMGAPELWRPPAVGAGAAWQLSSLLQPLSQLKAKTTVISGLENGSVFNADGSPSVEPAHGRQPGAWLTCVDGRVVADRLKVREANGVSVDQVMAAHAAFAGRAPLPSLQVGLSTTKSSCDGSQCSNSRSVSWKTETEPLYKQVDPKKVFDLLTRGVGAPPYELEQALVRQQSVLDAVLASAAVVRPKLSQPDRLRLDEYLTSVREVEQRLTASPVTGEPMCMGTAPPPFADFAEGTEYRENSAEYNKGTHADLMNDLIVLALRCDMTRIVSHMLEDERSEFTYDHVPRRHFTAAGSEPVTGVCGPYHPSWIGAGDDFATITWWNVGKVAELCLKLDAVADGEGKSLLDNCVVFLGSCMHGRNSACNELPALLIGGGGGALKTDQHVALNNRPLRDLYFTLMNRVYGMGVSDFGVNLTGAPISLIPELLT